VSLSRMMALRACVLAESSAFDKVVLDVMMPFMDGLQLTPSLRRQNILTPILLLTGRDAPEEIVRGLEAGADDYLAKPFELAILLARLQGLLRRREWLRSSVDQAPPAPQPSARPGWSGNGWLTGSRDTAGRSNGGLRKGCGSWVPWTGRSTLR